MKDINFERLNEALKVHHGSILLEILPGGKLIKNEYTCGNLEGDRGNSFKFNINTGLWSDFATGESGRDIISLYAKIKNVTNSQAARTLDERIGYSSSPKKFRPKPDFGPNSGVWEYYNKDGSLSFYTVRYNKPNNKKSFLPFSWSEELNQWVNKLPPPPRPLYGLRNINSEYVLVCEGEKATDAAAKITKDVGYSCVTWSCGSQAYKNTDWSPLEGKKVLLWPDEDDPGVKAMNGVYECIKDIAKEIKIIGVDAGSNTKNDAYDFLKDGKKWEDVKSWASPMIRVLKEEKLVIPAEIRTIKPTIKEISNDIFNRFIRSSSRLAVDVDIFTEDQFIIWEKLGLATTQSGNPIIDAGNCRRAILGINELKDSFWFDEFNNKIFTNIPTAYSNSSVSREVSNDDINEICLFLQEVIGMRRLSNSIVDSAITSVSFSKRTNEPKDWMDSLIWDGKKRIGTFFIDYMNSIDDEYSRAISKNFWVSMVARVFSPGCQVDSMVVIEGPQGTGKTSALRIIGGKWHCEAQENLNSNNFLQALEGKLIVEIAELSSFPTNDIRKIKQVISCNVDRFRSPYEKKPRTVPRRNIFVGTTNETHYLHDFTGARRFWPIVTGRVELDRISLDRDQLFAESVKAYKEGATFHEVPDDLATQEQERRRQYDVWELIIEKFTDNRLEFTTEDVANHLHISRKDLDMIKQRRIAGILTMLGFKLRRGYWTRDDSE